MIYVECKPDEALVRHVTGLPRRQVVHEFKGKYEVCKRVSAQADSRALIDEDPGSFPPAYLGRMTLSDDSPELGLKVYRDSRKSNTVVVLCPKLEDWILDAARAVGLNVRDYGLPSRPRELHGVVNANLQKFERLLNALETTPSPRLKTLRQLLA